MKIQCDCGAFQAKLKIFPKNSPRRLMCYCDSCQSYAEKIGREDVLDEFGGTQVIPVYPADREIRQGIDKLKCHRLSEKGVPRWSTTCCNSPIGNTQEKTPWIGLFHTTFTAADKGALERLGDIRSRIMGKYAKGKPPFKISPKIGFKDMLVVMPFIIKGKLTGKSKNNPFFKEGTREPFVEAEVL